MTEQEQQLAPQGAPEQLEGKQPAQKKQGDQLISFKLDNSASVLAGIFEIAAIFFTFLNSLGICTVATNDIDKWIPFRDVAFISSDLKGDIITCINAGAGTTIGSLWTAATWAMTILWFALIIVLAISAYLHIRKHSMGRKLAVVAIIINALMLVIWSAMGSCMDGSAVDPALQNLSFSPIAVLPAATALVSIVLCSGNKNAFVSDNDEYYKQQWEEFAADAIAKEEAKMAAKKAAEEKRIAELEARFEDEDDED